MKMFDVALSYARQGVPVFPVGLPSKRPLNMRGHLARSTDETQIKAWWTEWPDAAIGAVPVDQNAIVVDIDAGWDTHPETVAFVNSLPSTRTARTLNGGRHMWFETYLEFSNSKPFPNIDIRSANGYVIMPPSAGYTWTTDTHMTELPNPIAATLHKASPTDPDRISKHVGADTPAMRKTAIDYLKYQAPHAIQGQGGEAATFEIASELVRNIGLSDDLAHELMLKHWNPFKAHPKWDDGELRIKVWNAGEYGKASPGSARYPTSIPTPMWERMKDYTARDWLARVIEPKVPLIGPVNADSRVILAGPTGLGKTHFALGIAAHVAAGKPFLNWPVVGPRRVIYFDGEMPLSLIKERIQAAQAQLSMPADKEWQDNLMVYSTIDAPVGGFDTVAGMSWVEQKIEMFDPALVIFDNRTALNEGDDVSASGNILWGTSWATTMGMVKRITAQRIAQIWVDHLENDRFTGAKKNRYQIDTEIMMRAVEDAKGVEFDVWFGKMRERTPQNEALYVPGRVKLFDDQWSWKRGDISNVECIEIALRDAEGMPPGGWESAHLAEAMSEMSEGLTKPAAKMRLHRAKKSGLANHLLVFKGNSFTWRLPS